MGGLLACWRHQTQELCVRRMLQKSSSVAFSTFSPSKRPKPRRIPNAQKTGLSQFARGIGVQQARRVRGREQGDSHLFHKNIKKYIKTKNIIQKNCVFRGSSTGLKVKCHAGSFVHENSLFLVLFSVMSNPKNNEIPIHVNSKKINQKAVS